MTDTTKDTSYSLFNKDVFIYVLKAGLAGLILAGSTYGAHLISEYGNETKANAEQSKAQVKVDHYKNLKALATKSKNAGNTKLFKEFTEKHELAYKLALSDLKVTKEISRQPGIVLKLIADTSIIIATLSFVVIMLSGLYLVLNSREVNKNVQEFTIKNGEIELLKHLLEKQVKTIKNNQKISNATIRPHQELLKKLPVNLQIDGLKNKNNKFKANLWTGILMVLAFVLGLATHWGAKFL